MAHHRLFGLFTAAALVTSCGSTGSGGASIRGGDAWSADFDAPTELTTERIRLEPLHPRHTELDHAAFSSCNAYLQKTLQWAGWPEDDMTLEKNRGDLQRHWDEFEAHEAYAYTVLAPDGERCVGCLYINPTDVFGDELQGQIYFWVIESELEGELDRHLLEQVFAWFEAEWPFDKVLVPIRKENEGGLALVRSMGLGKVPIDPGGDYTGFVWKR